jgi:hypothetical protein
LCLAKHAGIVMRMIEAPLSDRLFTFALAISGRGSLTSPFSLVLLHGLLPRLVQECLCKRDACDVTIYGKFVSAHSRANQIFIYLPSRSINRTDNYHFRRSPDLSPSNRKNGGMPGETAMQPRKHVESIPSLMTIFSS